MAASYSLQDFVGDGVLKDELDKFEGDGWDDVPTLKMMSAADMEALQLTDAQRDALELRTYLHDRNLMQYADKLESARKSLPELLNTNPSELTSQYGMRRGHVARFVDRSRACGVQLPSNLVLPARKRNVASRDGESISSFMGRRAGQPEVSSPASVYSNSSMHKRRLSHDQFSVDSKLSGDSKLLEQNEYDLETETKTKKDRYEDTEAKKDRYEDTETKKDGYEEKSRSPHLKGMVATGNVEPRCFGLLKPSQVTDNVTPLSILEKIYVQKLTPEHRTGTDPWSGGDLKLPPPMKASELWGSKPTLLLCLRRPGCVMCRAEAHQLYARKAIFNAMGVQLVAVLNEYIDAEVKAFWPRYWGGMVVVDRNRDFFKSLGGGKLMKDNLITGFLFNSQAHRNWKRATSTGFNYNLHGEGMIKGGLYVVGPGKGGVAYQFMERNFGDWAPLEEVLDVCTNLQSSKDTEG